MYSEPSFQNMWPRSAPKTFHRVSVWLIDPGPVNWATRVTPTSVAGAGAAVVAGSSALGGGEADLTLGRAVAPVATGGVPEVMSGAGGERRTAIEHPLAELHDGAAGRVPTQAKPHARPSAAAHSTRRATWSLSDAAGPTEAASATRVDAAPAEAPCSPASKVVC
jgi:hypothetical protein